MRYSSKDCRRSFVALALDMGIPVQEGKEWRVGAWLLEYHTGFGYRIAEITNPEGGTDSPLMAGCLSAKEFCRACNMARYAVRRVQRDICDGK